MPDILLDAFKLKPAEAIAFLRKKGYAFSWNWFDVWRDAQARKFTIAKVMRADILQDVRGMVDAAIDEGITFAQFKKELIPRLQANGWWGIKETVDKETGLITETQLGSVARLQTIYRQNVQSAYMAGRYREQMEVADDLPIWEYVATIDSRTTERCRALNGRRFRADDPVWDTIYPPNHWGCRARVRARTERAAGRSVESSKGRMITKAVVVGSGDNAREVTVTGIRLDADHDYFPEAGFDYNPGKEAFAPDLDKSDTGITINGNLLPWSFVRRVWNKCGRDWEQTVDCFWKARKATGHAGIQKYIMAGFKSRGGGVPYMLQPSKERQLPGGKKKTWAWWHGLYISKKRPAADTAPTVVIRDDPKSMAEIFRDVFGGAI
jgi:SPP1 gp7 family putative phage head morphogenesis protein